MDHKEQIRLLTRKMEDTKLDPTPYQELTDENGTMFIPRKAVLKAINFSIEHHKSKISKKS